MSRSEAFVSPTAAQNMRLTFSPDGTAVYKPIASTSPPYQSPTAAAGNGVNIEGSAGVGGGGAPLPHGLNMNMSSVEPLKRKRGRPRKYGSDGSMSLALSPTAPGSSTPSSAGFSLPTPTAAGIPSGGSASPTSGKKSRGRPPGSGRKRQLEALEAIVTEGRIHNYYTGSVGIGFTPHVITVKAGEDVCSKIMSFSQNGPRAVCILSANGAISNVTLRQPAISGGTVTYEGRFEILSLSGSFLLSENGGHRSRTGGLSVSLSGSDGRVLGGGVAGLLTAASLVQVVVGSFVADGRKEPKQSKHIDHFSAPTSLPPSGGGLTCGSSPSHGTLSESSGEPGSPLNQSSGACTNSNPPPSMPNMTWK